MSRQQPSAGAIDVSVESIGGIDEAAVTLQPGVTVLAGRNATNRTSFLQALMAVFGSEGASLKGDAEEGSVTMTYDGETYTRTLVRRNGGVAFGGDPYLDDPELADLFAFLLETNEARQAIATGGDLRELIMRPVNTDEIEARIEELLAERRDIDDRIDEVESRADELPALEGERRERADELAGTRAELDAVRGSIEEADADLETRRERQSELESILDDLSTARSEREDVRYRLETEREALASAREELVDVEEEIDDLPSAPAEELSELTARIDRLRERKRDCEAAISKLQSLVQFNEEMMDGDGGLRDLLGGERRAVTDELLPEEGRTTCWTCGSEVDVERIESMVDELRELSREQRAERADMDEEVTELTERRRTLEGVEERREELARRRERLVDDVESREAAIETLEAEADDLSEEIGELEERAGELEGAEESEILELHKRANHLEVEADRTAEDVEELDAKIATLEDDLEFVEGLRERREEVDERLTHQRTRIERLEREATEAFDEHMNDLLDVLGYGNLERVWIERVERERRERRRTVTRPAFELHVVRTGESGTAYEDTVDHLSESEREVTGLVFALAGYLVHDVYETVPFMLLDSLEAIDSERIAALVDYFRGYAPTIVVALLPEDAAALDDDVERVREV